jgi:hypothetical protein
MLAALTGRLLETHIGRTSDLGRGGCSIDTMGPFPVGTVLGIRINRENQTHTIEAPVVFSQAGMGMGLAKGCCKTPILQVPSVGPVISC